MKQVEEHLPPNYLYNSKKMKSTQMSIKNRMNRGTWVAQSVKRPTPDLSSGHDLTVREFEPCIRLCADSSESGACFGFCVSLSLCPSPAHTLSLSVSKINKTLKKNFFFKKGRERQSWFVGLGDDNTNIYFKIFFKLQVLFTLLYIWIKGKVNCIPLL